MNYKPIFQTCIDEFEACATAEKQEYQKDENKSIWQLIHTMKSSTNLSKEEKKELFVQIKAGKPPYGKLTMWALYSKLCSKPSSSSFSQH